MLKLPKMSPSDKKKIYVGGPITQFLPRALSFLTRNSCGFVDSIAVVCMTTFHKVMNHGGEISCCSIGCYSSDASGNISMEQVQERSTFKCHFDQGRQLRNWKSTLYQGHIADKKMFSTRGYLVVTRHFSTSQVNTDLSRVSSSWRTETHRKLQSRRPSQHPDIANITSGSTHISANQSLCFVCIL